MSALDKIRRENLIQQAEGYLDLILCLEDRWALPENLTRSMTEKALKALARLESSSGRRSHIEFLKGQAFRIQLDYESAIESFEESLEMDSENIHALSGLAWCLKRVGRIDTAIEVLKRALDLQPDNPTVLFNLACYWGLKANVEKCCSYLRQAIEIDESLIKHIELEPDFADVRNNPEFQSIISTVGEPS